MRGEGAPSPIYEGEDSVIAWMLDGPDANYTVPLQQRTLSKWLVGLHRKLDATSLRPRLDAATYRGRWIRARDLSAIHDAIERGADIDAEKRVALHRIRELVFDTLAEEAIG